MKLVQTRFIAFLALPRFIASSTPTRSIAFLFVLSFTLMPSLKAQDTIPTVKIGNQVWMVKNLDVVTFRNGDNIEEAKSDSAWRKASAEGKPAWCYYDNDPKNGKKYGKLYNWYAVNDPRGLALKGYHVPSQGEWFQLIEYLGGDSIAGKRMKSTEDWFEDGDGTNESGFLAIPGGWAPVNPNYNPIGYEAYWWNSNEKDLTYACFLMLDSENNFSYGLGKKGQGFSVRCLRD